MGKGQYDNNGKTNKISGKTATAIFNGYIPTEACPPFQDHWGGKSLVGSEWLRKFAEEVESEPLKTTAWNELSEICGGSLLIELLYLFTCRFTLKHQQQDASPLLIRDLDRLLSAYEKLSYGVVRLQIRRKVRVLSVYMADWFREEFQHLQSARESLNRHREFFVRHRVSIKTDPRDWYLYLIASRLMKATGSYKLGSLATLIDAASAAHGESTHLHTPLGLKKRIQRYTKRFQTVDPKPARHFEDADDEDIPF